MAYLAARPVQHGIWVGRSSKRAKDLGLKLKDPSGVGFRSVGP